MKISARGGNRRVKVAFKPRPATGPVTYRVIASPGGAQASGTRSPITVRGLRNGRRYRFRVSATNVGGTSPASRSVSRGHAIRTAQTLRARRSGACPAGLRRSRSRSPPGSRSPKLVSLAVDAPARAALRRAPARRARARRRAQAARIGHVRHGVLTIRLKRPARRDRGEDRHARRLGDGLVGQGRQAPARGPADDHAEDPRRGAQPDLGQAAPASCPDGCGARAPEAVRGRPAGGARAAAARRSAVRRRADRRPGEAPVPAGAAGARPTPGARARGSARAPARHRAAARRRAAARAGREAGRRPRSTSPSPLVIRGVRGCSRACGTAAPGRASAPGRVRKTRVSSRVAATLSGSTRSSPKTMRIAAISAGTTGSAATRSQKWGLRSRGDPANTTKAPNRRAKAASQTMRDVARPPSAGG